MKAVTKEKVVNIKFGTRISFQSSPGFLHSNIFHNKKYDSGKVLPELRARFCKQIGFHLNIESRKKEAAKPPGRNKKIQLGM